ncbi:phosphatidylserine decarboxylase [Echinicola jeungdonensis]|uniref:phosphatidylserine decarboxylase n=1 Tax=Echinicola jeungdonensis TaxID=709343 RepID=UPI0025B33FFD|nr:phosphatidylserine decarboxylase [Echinicola jeungdonensis]MDN3671400.1 phosphatidylserine decarboxylase [Echinicola jeungdonensis]
MGCPNKRYGFDPSSIGWQVVETRGCVILDTSKYGLVALLPIGMAVVNSVNLEKQLKPGDKVKKGICWAILPLAAPTLLWFFQDKVNFTLTAPREGDGFKPMLMGEELGRVK